MKIIKFISLILLGFSLQGCPKYSREPDMRFIIKNMSNENIYFYGNTEDVLKYPKDIYSGKEYLNKIDIGEEYLIKYWKNLFKEKKWNIIIFKQTTLDLHTWQEIQEQNIFDKQYILTLDELKALKYEIVYDGK